MIVDIALPIPVAKTFSYAVPDKWKPFANRFLRAKVSFRNRIHTGVITDVHEGDNSDLKEIDEIIDFFPIVDTTLIKLCTWASNHYITPIGAVLKYLLPPNLNVEPYIVIKSSIEETSSMDGFSLRKAIRIFGRPLVFHYLENNKIALRDIFTESTFSPLPRNEKTKEMPENILFIGDVQNRLDYYADIIAAILRRGNNVLMLLPDHYAAGNYFKKIFTDTFGENVLWYGSEISARARMETFFTMRNRRGVLVLGNKSCVFLPMCRQALVIIERQEEDEYRNEEIFKFNAVTLAIKRASLENIPVVLGSACPSIEMYHYAKNNNFKLIEKKWILDNLSQEKITIPDIRSSAGFLEELIPLIREGIQAGEKIAVFTPRKDYGSYLVCHSCKKPFLCPHCEGVLAYEKETQLLVCSMCGEKFPYKEQCVWCGSNIIRFSRIGVEYVEEKLKDIFPNISIIKVTGDSLKSQIKTIRKAPVDLPVILIGTQSLSKLYGFHVQKLILIGWEELRKIGGYRSDEKMVQILANLIDALTPETVTLLMERRNKINIENYLQWDRYFQEELLKRKNADFPPFQRVFLVEVVNKNRERGEKTIGDIKTILQQEGVETAVSGILMEKKTLYKWKIILRVSEDIPNHALFRIYNLPTVHIEPDPLYL